ncbi:MAG: hypothetical protein JWO83_1267 [Caulobacteraceae bacterium]|nr:hypothetical protein [Caulobacteraceae bacterium]
MPGDRNERARADRQGQLQREAIGIGQPVGVIFEDNGLPAPARRATERADALQAAGGVDVNFDVRHVSGFGPGFGLGDERRLTRVGSASAASC